MLWPYIIWHAQSVVLGTSQRLEARRWGSWARHTETRGAVGVVVHCYHTSRLFGNKLCKSMESHAQNTLDKITSMWIRGSFIWQGRREWRHLLIYTQGLRITDSVRGSDSLALLCTCHAQLKLCCGGCVHCWGRVGLGRKCPFLLWGVTLHWVHHN